MKAKSLHIIKLGLFLLKYTPYIKKMKIAKDLTVLVWLKNVNMIYNIYGQFLWWQCDLISNYFPLFCTTTNNIIEHTICPVFENKQYKTELTEYNYTQKTLFPALAYNKNIEWQNSFIAECKPCVYRFLP